LADRYKPEFLKSSPTSDAMEKRAHKKQNYNYEGTGSVAIMATITAFFILYHLITLFV